MNKTLNFAKLNCLYTLIIFYTLFQATCGDGVVFAFGKNDWGQIGNGTIKNQMKPLKISHDKKFIDIASHWRAYTSIGLSSENVYYVWGELNENKFLRPEETNFKTLDEIFENFGLDTSGNFENDAHSILENGCFEKDYSLI